MPHRSTPSPELAPDGPPPVNGSLNHVETSATTLLLDCPAEPAARADGAPAEVNASDRPADAADADAAFRDRPAVADAAPGARAAEAQAEPHRDGQPKHRSVVVEAQKLATGTVRVLEKRGARSTVLGVALVAIGIALGATSAVAVALLVVGVVTLIVGLMGRRVQGRFAIEFGADGASIELQAHFASPGHTQLVAPLAPWEPGCAPVVQEPLRASGR